jgi:hypothetical protein
MRKQLILFALLAASIGGCAKHSTTAVGEPRLDDFPSFNGAKVEVVAEGGIAALLINHVVRHDDHYFQYTQRRLCNNACAAMDSASGLLTAAATDSLFNIVLSPSPFALKDDYGTTHGAADMMEYTVRVTAGGSTKTIRADDATMPPQLRRIVDVVRGTISAARR